jgi:hypothetical protein
MKVFKLKFKARERVHIDKLQRLVSGNNYWRLGFSMGYNIVWEPDGIHKHYSGFVTGREFLESYRKIHSDPRFDEVRYVINDLTKITGHELTADALTDLAVANFGAHLSNPNCRVVFVTSDGNLAKTITKNLMSPDLKSYQVEVKSTVSEARDWLDSQPKLFEMSGVMGLQRM